MKKPQIIPDGEPVELDELDQLPNGSYVILDDTACFPSGSRIVVFDDSVFRVDPIVFGIVRPFKFGREDQE